MALSDERIDAIDVRTLGHKHFARAIEAEVRKDDEALIRQMLNILEQYQFGLMPGTHGEAAITAARARLEQPCA